MGIINRLILLFIVALLAYILWPRSPSFATFNPEETGRLEAEAWVAVAKGEHMDAAKSYYLLFDRQFGLPPMAAVMGAQNVSRALQLIRKGADDSDQEKAIPLLQEFYISLKKETKSDWDAVALARMDYDIWYSLANGADAAAVAPKITAYWAMLLGPKTASLTKAATERGEAMLASSVVRPGTAVDEAKVQSLLKQSWQAIKTALGNP